MSDTQRSPVLGADRSPVLGADRSPVLGADRSPIQVSLIKQNSNANSILLPGI